MKQCTKCREYKSLVDFHKTQQTKDKYTFHCKTCNKKARKEYYKKNKDKVLIQVKNWQFINKDKVRATRATYKYSKRNATPSWLTNEHYLQIESLYWLAKLQKELTDIDFHVDHIVPLRGKTVCGLHVPWNLQVLSAKDNLSKSNKV